ncbi:MAG: hypothetical protein HOV80_36190 [Polyangiaceae bacterium]|nr:hypothetical protein [Polyangiaceae bacterium]
MSLQSAARVGDPIEHRSDAIAIGLGLAAALLGGWFAVAATATASAVATALAAIGLGANAGGTGLIVGNWLRSANATSVAGHIVSGAPTVAIGASTLAAANASPTTRVDCHSSFVSQGSRTVCIENAHASRKGDKTQCGGTIAAGCPTVSFGGEPVGGVGPEANGTAFRWLNGGFAIAGGLSGLSRAAWMRLVADPKKPVDVAMVALGGTELTGAALGMAGLPMLGRTTSMVANASSIALRWQRAWAAGGVDKIGEAIIRTPGTAARAVSYLQNLPR